MNRALRGELSFLSTVAAVGCLFTGKRKTAALMGLGALALQLYPKSATSFRGSTILITGGSRGLGLALAEELLREEAQVIIAARNREELETAQRLLQQRTNRVPLIFTCDVTSFANQQSLFAEIDRQFYGLDLVINNAGSISVGPLEAMRREDFQGLLDLQVHAVVDSTRLALPLFAKRGKGMIVNICSIGGKIAIPHLSSYCTAKFALAGLSSAMGMELADQNVHVLTVYPGLMRTGSPINALYRGDPEKEYAWFAAGDVLPGVSISAQEAAARIVQSIRAEDRELVFPGTAGLAAFTSKNFPEITAAGLRLAAHFFPTMKSGIPREGKDCRKWLESKSWYQPLRPIMENAQEKYNQPRE